MANTLKLKRSAVQNKVPLTTDLQLGELAVNTYDGKLYLKKDNGTESIVEIGAGGGSFVPLSGGTMTGKLTLPGVTTSGAPLRLTNPSTGDVPSAPENGDVWINNNGMQFRQGTTTQTLATLGGTQTFTGATTFQGTLNATSNVNLGSNSGAATHNLAHGATTSGSTKTVNIGTGGLSGSTTNITIGSIAGTVTTTINGSVGVGASSATVKLVVADANKNSWERGNFHVYTTDTAAVGKGAQITLGGAYSGNVEIPFGGISARCAQVGGGGGYLSLLYQDTTGTLVEGVRITPAGNVGIGTGSPGVYVGYRSLALNGTTGGVFDIQVNGTRSGTMYYDSALRVRTVVASSVILGTNSVDHLEVSSAGNVGVGVTPSGTYKLEVNGSISGTTLRSSVATGTAPLTVASTTAVTNLNADLLDGSHASAFALLTGATFTGDITTYRSGTPTTGVIFLGNSGTKYLFFDGTSYVMPAANLYVNGGLALTASNYSSYSLPLTGGTMTGKTEINKTTTVTVGSSGGSDQFEIRNNSSGGCIMSFHRVGQYAINMGLDTDGGFRLGGWSNGTNVYRWASDTSGNFVAQSNVTAYSDIRIKKDLAKIDDALAKVESLTGYTFTRTDTGQRQTGLIAQDVQKVLPEAVLDDGERLSLAYGQLAGLLVEAIKQLKAEVDAVKAQLH